jgi:hypothetical protein
MDAKGNVISKANKMEAGLIRNKDLIYQVGCDLQPAMK